MMRLASPAFSDGTPIPRQHAADGRQLSPPLGWSAVPRGTRSLVLLMEDADTPSPAGPSRPWLHWAVYNLQPSSAGIDLGANSTGLPPSARSGLNDFGEATYAGPAPRNGEHHYVFRLLALDTTLKAPARGARRREELLEAVAGHTLETAELTGTYWRGEE
jgi:Raf kinase inhibitor-like YbhB/YbcL family protein